MSRNGRESPGTGLKPLDKLNGSSQCLLLKWAPILPMRPEMETLKDLHTGQLRGLAASNDSRLCIAGCTISISSEASVLSQN